MSSSKSAHDKKARVVKLRNYIGSYKVDLNSWRRHSLDTLFDDVYSQQEAYKDELDWLEEDIEAAKKRKSKHDTEYKSRIADLEAKLAKQETKAKTSSARVLELEAKLAAQEEQLNASESRVSELETTLRKQETKLHAAKTQISELEAREMSHQCSNSQSDTSTAKVDEKHQSTPASGSTFTAPEPPKLGDKAQLKFLNWKYLLQRKLAAVGESSDTATSSLDYVISQTSGEAQEQLVARLRSVVLKPITNANEALEFLDLLYNDPELETRDPRDFKPTDQPRDGYWAAFSDFVWNAVKYKIPEDEWGFKLHEYMLVQFGEDMIGDFSTYSTGPLKELGKAIYLNVLRQTE
ncbi:hypothetical protein BJX62DRAFT_238827 [Aspergillus germanicus]